MSIAQVVNRLLQLIPVIIGVTFIVFLLMYLTPGDPVEAMFSGEGAVSEEDLALYRRELGLDRPFPRAVLSLFGRTVAGRFRHVASATAARLRLSSPIGFRRRSS